MIVMVGFMGAGKSTVGRLLADQLGLPFADSDELIELATGLSIADIFEGFGEAGFREIEAGVIVEQLAGPPGVFALGGGAVTSAPVRAALVGHDVVLLEISLADALSRVGGDPRRPLLHRHDLERIFAGRAGQYRAVATLTVAAAGRSPQEVAQEIAAAVVDPGAVRLDPGASEAGE